MARKLKSAASSPPSSSSLALLGLVLLATAASSPTHRGAVVVAFSPPPLATTTASRSISSKVSRSFLLSTAVPVDVASATASSSDDDGDEQEEENITTTDFLSLDYIRSTLVRQEETIIFALIERALFRRNEVCYEVGGVPSLGVPAGVVLSDEEKEAGMSFLDYMLSGTEALHSIVRRYESPQEHAFFPSRLPRRDNSLAILDYADLLSGDPEIDNLNWNKILEEKYLNVIMPAVCSEGDDEQYGSTVISDIAALQALSKRVHFGKFVAESKYRGNPEGFQKLVDENDPEGVMELLTNSVVEAKILARARLKASAYGREPLLSSLPKLEDGSGRADGTTAIIAAAAAQAVVAAVEAMKKKDDGSSSSIKGKVDPAIIEGIYEKIIIPMTKDVEVAYLFLRCGKEPPEEYQSNRMSIDVTEL